MKKECYFCKDSYEFGNGYTAIKCSVCKPVVVIFSIDIEAPVELGICKKCYDEKIAEHRKEDHLSIEVV